MVQFFLADVCSRWAEIEFASKAYEKAAYDPEKKNQALVPEDFHHLAKIECHFNFICQTLALEHTSHHFAQFEHALKHEASTAVSVHILLKNLKQMASKEMAEKTVTFIPPDTDQYFQNDQLVDPLTWISFTSARYDIEAAGNCLAAGLFTAAVFHSMRVVEHGIRALANDLRIKIKNRSIESAEWGPLIKAIREKIEIRQGKFDKSKRKKRGEYKALSFYRATTDEINVFREFWRNNTMHTRCSYNKQEAIGVFSRVCDFMNRLASFPITD